MDFDDVDYFPSFEIISSHPAPKSFFEENLRSVAPEGVARVMRLFLTSHGVEVSDDAPETEEEKTARIRAIRQARRVRRQKAAQGNEDDVVCEEALLEAFSK